MMRIMTDLFKILCFSAFFLLAMVGFTNLVHSILDARDPPIQHIHIDAGALCDTFYGDDTDDDEHSPTPEKATV